MSKVKTGDTLNCEVCGLTVIVDEECGCAVAEVICCDEPMVNKGPAAPKKTPIAVGAAKKKTAVKKAKPAAAKKAPKPAAKKKVAPKAAAKKAVKKAAKK
jgi:hypothetical protein